MINTYQLKNMHLRDRVVAHVQILPRLDPADSAQMQYCLDAGKEGSLASRLKGFIYVIHSASRSDTDTG
jgi:hypothetical protein